jgi:AcrR family transcriptional regulator
MSDEKRKGGAEEGGDAAKALKDTPERIRRAAVEILEREGADRATVRAIAHEAGVNIAAINYHFKTMEALMDAAIVSTWEHALGDMRSLLDYDAPEIGKGIEALALYLLRGGRSFPNVTKAQLLGTRTRPAPAIILASYRNFAVETAAKVCEALAIPCNSDAVARTSALFSSILLTGLVPESLPEEFLRDDFAPAAAILTADYLENLKRSAHKPGD